MNMNFKITMTALTLSLVAATANSQAIEVYSGMTFGGQDLNYGPAPNTPPNLQQMDSGPILGAGVYWDLPGSFEVGVDLMYTNQGYTTWGPGSSLESLSLMANARSLFAIPNTTMTAYAGLGLGAIGLRYDDPLQFAGGTDMIAGWQIETGTQYPMNSYSLFTAIKYQAGFAEGTIQTESVEYNSTSLVLGARF